jgi:beta-lactamase regulating signal transducer with metallopeptidase domain
LVADPGRRRALGTAARRAALERSEQRYAQGLFEFIAAACNPATSAQPVAAGRATFADRLARMLDSRSRRRDDPPHGAA